MTRQLIFRMPRVVAERTAPAPAPEPRKDVPPRDAMLCGTAFNEDGVDWKVIAVLWSSLEKQVVVWYYDVEVAAAEAADTGKAIEEHEEEMVRFASAIACVDQNPGEYPGSLERSSVMEIRKWIHDDQMKQKRANC